MLHFVIPVDVSPSARRRWQGAPEPRDSCRLGARSNAVRGVESRRDATGNCEVAHYSRTGQGDRHHVTPADDIAQSAGPVRVRLVGPLRVYIDGRRVADPPAGRAASLLGLLAVDAGHLVPIDRIIDDLWPDGPPVKAKEN